MTRIALRASLALSALLLLLAVTIALLLYSPLGPWSASRLLPALLPSGVTVEGLGGQFARALHVDHVHLESDGLVLDIYDIDTRYQPFGLLFPPRSITVDTLDAGRVEIQLRPTTSDSPDANAGEPFALPAAPVDVVLASLTVDALEVTSMDAWQLSAEDLSAAGRWDQEGATVEPFEGSAQIISGALQAPLEVAVSGAARLPVDLNEALRVDIDLDARSSAYPSIAMTGRAQGALAQTTQLTLQVTEPAAVDLSATLTGLLTEAALTGEAQLTIAEPVRLDEFDASLPPITLGGRLGASLADEVLRMQPALDIGLDAFESVREAQRAAFVDGELRLATRAEGPYLDLDPLRVKLGSRDGVAGELRLRGQGSTAPSLALRLEMERLDPAWVARAWPGAIEGSAQVEASKRASDTWPAFELANLEVSGTLREQPISVRGGAQLSSAGKVRIEAWQARSASASLTLDGTVELIPTAPWPPRSIALRSAISAPALEEVLPQTSGSIEGEIAISGTLASPKAKANITASEVRWADRLAVQNATSAVSVEGLEDIGLRLDARGLSSGALRLHHVALASAGRVDGHTITLQVGAEEDRNDLDLQLTGALDLAAQAWQGHIDRLSAGVLDRRWGITAASNETANQLTVSAGAQALGPICMTAPPHPDQVCIDLARADDRVDADIALTSVALGPWAALLTLPGTLEGELEGQLALHQRTGELASLEGQLRLAPGTYALTGDEEQGLRWGVSTLDVATAQAALIATANLDLTDAGQLALRAQLPRQLFDASTPQHTLALDAELTGKLTVPPRLAEAVPGLGKLAGNVDVDLRADGTLGAPALAGGLTLRDGTAQIPSAGLLVDEATFTLAAQPEAIALDGSANTGEGTLATQARFKLIDGGWRGELSLDGTDVLVMDTPQVRALISPALRATVDAGARRVRVEGSVTVPEARLRPLDLSSAVQVSPDEVIVGEGAAESADQDPWVSEAVVTLRLGDEVSYKGGGFNGRLVGALTVREPADGLPTGDGELSVADASFSAFGQSLSVDRGRVIFIDSPLANPGLDIQASRAVEDITVRVDVRGTLRRQVISLSSQPSLPQADALSYLVVGRPVSELRGGESVALSDAARQTGLAGADLLARRVGRRIGLDELGVESEQGGDNAQLVVGKYLSPRLYVRYGLGLFETLNTWLLRYDLSRRWSLETQTGAQNSADLLYSIEN